MFLCLPFVLHPCHLYSSSYICLPSVPDSSHMSLFLSRSPVFPALIPFILYFSLGLSVSLPSWTHTLFPSIYLPVSLSPICPCHMSLQIIPTVSPSVYSSKFPVKVFVSLLFMVHFLSLWTPIAYSAHMSLYSLILIEFPQRDRRNGCEIQRQRRKTGNAER